MPQQLADVPALDWTARGPSCLGLVADFSWSVCAMVSTQYRHNSTGSCPSMIIELGQTLAASSPRVQRAPIVEFLVVKVLVVKGLVVKGLKILEIFIGLDPRTRGRRAH